MKNFLLNLLPKAAVLSAVALAAGAAEVKAQNYGYQYHYAVDPCSGTWSYNYQWHVTPSYVPVCRPVYHNYSYGYSRFGF